MTDENQLAKNEVQTSVGKFKLRIPKAGVIMDASEEAWSKNGTNEVTMIKSILNKSVIESPFKIPVSEGLRDLEMADYKLLINKIRELMNVDGDVEKK